MKKKTKEKLDCNETMIIQLAELATFGALENYNCGNIENNPFEQLIVAIRQIKKVANKDLVITKEK